MTPLCAGLLAVPDWENDGDTVFMELAGNIWGESV